MLPSIVPILQSLFQNVEWTKKLGRQGDIEKIMLGRWLPNTPTAEVAYLTYVVRGLPIPEDMANTIYNEYLQQNEDAYMETLQRGGRGGSSPSESDEEPATAVATEAPPSPVSAEDAKNVALKVLQQLGFPVGGDEGGVVAEGTTAGKPPFMFADPRLSMPTKENASMGEKQTDPFIRLLQTALVMRMLGGTGGAFGALALAPILKDLFDEMMGRKKRDTGQGDKGNEGKPSTSPALASAIPITPSKEASSPQPKAVDEVVAQLYNRGLSPQQIALAIPLIISEVELTPEQVEQILNNRGVQGVHIPTSQSKKDGQTTKKPQQSK